MLNVKNSRRSLGIRNYYSERGVIRARCSSIILNAGALPCAYFRVLKGKLPVSALPLSCVFPGVFLVKISDEVFP